jgi:hypothetical protein
METGFFIFWVYGKREPRERGNFALGANPAHSAAIEFRMIRGKHCGEVAQLPPEEQAIVTAEIRGILARACLMKRVVELRGSATGSELMTHPRRSKR